MDAVLRGTLRPLPKCDLLHSFTTRTLSPTKHFVYSGLIRGPSSLNDPPCRTDWFQSSELRKIVVARSRHVVPAEPFYLLYDNYCGWPEIRSGRGYYSGRSL
ncbi:hypothetical protein ATANTOWER_024162 [Ataeniobius toweri]|uniref:Uncharacterized protein n=1 Tax=Ataeniobius toweri TaxID=208326 RepID=A0ABU7BRP2_9TELE|nr:hypothetical protein [Ataeniobius toweri]